MAGNDEIYKHMEDMEGNKKIGTNQLSANLANLLVLSNFFYLTRYFVNINRIRSK